MSYVKTFAKTLSVPETVESVAETIAASITPTIPFISTCSDIRIYACSGFAPGSSIRNDIAGKYQISGVSR